MVGVHARFFLHSSAGGDLGCLCTPSIVSDAAVPVGVQTSLGVPAVLFFIFLANWKWTPFKNFYFESTVGRRTNAITLGCWGLNLGVLGAHEPVPDTYLSPWGEGCDLPFEPR